MGGAVRQRVGVLSEPVDRPAVDRLGHRGEVDGHPVDRNAGLRQGAGHLAVQGTPHGGRHGLIERLPDQAVPELEPVATLGQDAGGGRLVQQRQQRARRMAGDGRQVVCRKVGAQQRGDPQHRSRLK